MYGDGGVDQIATERAQPVVRGEAARSLNAVCAMLDTGRLTQEAVDEANRAVVACMNALPSLPPNQAR